MGIFVEIAKDVLQLCNEFKNDGVVGIDVAGAEFFPTPPEIRDVFKVCNFSYSLFIISS